jgi:hypothetical protein
MTSQLDAIQKTLGIHVGSAEAGFGTAYSTTSSMTQVPLPSPRPISSASPENDSKDLAGRPDESAFYRASHFNDIPDTPISLGSFSLDTDQVRGLFSQ